MKGKLAILLIACMFLLSACTGKGEQSDASSSIGTTQTQTTAEANRLSFEKEKLILLCELPQHELYLFGLGEFDQIGVVLYQNDTETYFPWKNRFPSQDARMAYSDYDGDGKNEIVISFGAGTGTGMYLEDLHVFVTEETKQRPGEAQYSYVDHSLLAADRKSWGIEVPQLQLPIQPKTNTIQLAGEIYPIAFPVIDGFSLTKLFLGDIIRFSFGDDDHISVEIGIYVEYARGEQFMREYCGTMSAAVIFDGTRFTFAGLTFVADEEYHVN